MARIRTIKPDFFRHEGLQDLEIANPGKYPMMVFAGLWGHCDKAGRFEFKPRLLKLDILPFIPFDMGESLGLLVTAGYIEKYSVAGKDYGVIHSFAEHQRINGKEAQEPEKHPAKPVVIKGSNREATGKQQRQQEGKGREEEGNGVGSASSLDVPVSPSAQPKPETSDEKTKGSRLPADWLLPKAWGEWALTEQPSWTADHCRKVAEKFRDHWIGQAGAKARKADWQATWRNWVRTEGAMKSESGAVIPLAEKPKPACCGREEGGGQCQNATTGSVMGRHYCPGHRDYAFDNDNFRREA